MHQIEIACLCLYEPTAWLNEFLASIASGQLLLANAGSEVGIGGGGTSICAVESTPSGFHLEKHALAISYGEYADAVVASARRTSESEAFDEVAVVCLRSHLKLEASGTWNTLGLRGTCSNSFRLTADGESGQVLYGYGEVAVHAGAPLSNILRGHVWLGIAEAAASKAHRVVLGQARKQVGTLPPASLRLAELIVPLQQLRDSLVGAVHDFDATLHTPEADSLSFITRMEALKVSVSTLLLDVIGRAVIICGINGYRQDSPESLSRLLRDAYASPVMVNNDRSLKSNAQRLVARKEI